VVISIPLSRPLGARLAHTAGTCDIIDLQTNQMYITAVSIYPSIPALSLALHHRTSRSVIKLDAVRLHGDLSPGIAPSLFLVLFLSEPGTSSNNQISGSFCAIVIGTSPSLDPRLKRVVLESVMVIRYILRFDPLKSFILELFALFIFANDVACLANLGLPVGSRSSRGRDRQFCWDDEARL